MLPGRRRRGGELPVLRGKYALWPDKQLVRCSIDSAAKLEPIGSDRDVPVVVLNFLGFQTARKRRQRGSCETVPDALQNVL